MSLLPPTRIVPYLHRPPQVYVEESAGLMNLDTIGMHNLLHRPTLLCNHMHEKINRHHLNLIDGGIYRRLLFLFPYRNIPALINHIRPCIGEQELIDWVNGRLAE